MSNIMQHFVSADAAPIDFFSEIFPFPESLLTIFISYLKLWSIP